MPSDRPKAAKGKAAGKPMLSSLLKEARAKPVSKLEKKRVAHSHAHAVMDAASAPAAPPPPPARIVRQRKADTNVVAISLGTLAQDAQLMTGDAVRCAGPLCGAFFSSISTPTAPAGAAPGDEAREWKCEFCGHVQPLDMAPEEMPREASVDYVLEAAPAGAAAADGAMDHALIFAVDTSGSMCVTTEVPGNFKVRGSDEAKRAMEEAVRQFGDGSAQHMRGQSRGVTYVSQLQCVQAAVESQLDSLERTAPSVRCGLISFADDVMLHGDGAGEPKTIAGDRLRDYAETLSAGRSISLENGVAAAKPALSRVLYSLQENGATALGPALLAAVGAAGQRPASKVILCTDGRANVGLGSIDAGQTESERTHSAAFYQRVGEYARELGVSVSIVTIEGSDCSLENIGAVADATGGKVDIVSPLNLRENFGAVLADPIIATNVALEFRLHHGLRFREGEVGVTEGGSVLGRVIGNVTSSSDTTLEYGIKRDFLASAPEAEFSLPFQVVITYTKLDGMKCVRVITQSKRITRSRDAAEAVAKMDVLGLNQLQHGAKLVREGAYGEAQRQNVSAVRMMARLAKDDDRQRQYVNFVRASEGLDTAMRSELQQEYNAGVYLSDSDGEEAERDAPVKSVHMKKKSDMRSRARNDTSAKAVFQSKQVSKSAFS
eukprot:c14663_g1_i1.p1 GENE.c14663_g1_i1~~c14663_g1_i1.p1  ORF type:complete len:663 (-),score=141.41 c14663_g1_i1:40-2028(-)